MSILTCPDCGRQHVTPYGHQACAKHRTKRGPAGELVPCGKPPVDGADACATHGAAKGTRARAAADRRAEEQEADEALRRGLAAAYGDQVPDVDPGDAMLRAVSWKYAEVLALRAKVAELEDDQRVWGATRVEVEGGTALRIDFDKDGVSGVGSAPSTKRIETAGANIWWQMLRTAEDQLVKFAAAARAAGCDERRVQLAEQQASLVVGVIQRILDGLYQHLVSAGVTADVLASAWQAAIADVVPRELRAAALGGVA